MVSTKAKGFEVCYMAKCIQLTTEVDSTDLVNTIGQRGLEALVEGVKASRVEGREVSVTRDPSVNRAVQERRAKERVLHFDKAKRERTELKLRLQIYGYRPDALVFKRVCPFRSFRTCAKWIQIGEAASSFPLQLWSLQCQIRNSKSALCRCTLDQA